MSKRLLRLLLLFCGVSLLAFIVLYPSLPAEIPLNYGLDGEATSYGPKASLIILEVLPALVAIGMYLVPKVDPRRKNHETHRRGYSLISIIVVGMCLCLDWVMVLPLLGVGIPVGSAIQLTLGLALTAMGNYMPQLRSNFFAGIRTPWALSDEVVWRKTHRMGGVVFCAGGILMALNAFLPGLPLAQLASLFVFLGGCVWCFIYSYLVYRKRHKSKEDEHAEN